MPRFNVQRPSDKKWACFSTIVDDYVTVFMDEKEYQKWREMEYGRNIGPISEANQMSFEAAEYRVRDAKEAYEQN